MNTEDATLILCRSILNLEAHKGNLTGADLEAEVINNACLVILKNERARVNQNILQIAHAFTDAAAYLYPDRYKEVSIINAIGGIQQNVAWDGMWEFLKGYYRRNHGIEIDNK
jgi:hypothetical protein